MVKVCGVPTAFVSLGPMAIWAFTQVFLAGPVLPPEPFVLMFTVVSLSPAPGTTWPLKLAVTEQLPTAVLLTTTVNWPLASVGPEAGVGPVQLPADTAAVTVWLSKAM